MSADVRSWDPAAGPRSLDAFVRRENFPVASRLLPVRRRGHLLAVYRFARFVDDIGDRAPPHERLAYLDAVEEDLRRLYSGGMPKLPPVLSLADAVHVHGIPSRPFERLIQANRQDQVVSRYETFDELQEYCVLSAEPVGHIVLYLFGAATPDRFVLSDRICTALQIIEHCQDVGEDHRRGRVYLPQEDLRRFGCTDRDLSCRVTPTRLRGVLALQARRARRLLDEGAPLVGLLPGLARPAVAGYVAGGRAALASLERRRYDVLCDTPRPARVRLAAEWARALKGS
ncbi:phytoene synthase [Actinomadura sp. NBRC 104412]|uniref:squalene synthase HpnC n=1 Tax=Actinomadura sp. NBRC 104412 TaxID=3032203 RepID=UPI0024A56930|nr:squalene synthase HpnC [Actinomadura sp. NBRC 104412]GLZ06303.1 phytoene synthase [Actinomadura sp. NBRC 104412]